MDILKKLFDGADNETKSLTYEQFMEAVAKADIKLANLSDGQYVSKQKYDSELAAKDEEIGTLNGTLSTRDADLADLQKKLDEAGTDAEALANLSNDFNVLKGKYDDDVKAYKAQLKKQAYEFAVKEFANTKEFTSNAAKRDFIQSMLGKELKMENGSILGAEDFTKVYTEENSDAFVVKQPTEPTPTEPKPQFISSTQGETLGEKPSLTQLMQAKNENPSLSINL